MNEATAVPRSATMLMRVQVLLCVRVYAETCLFCASELEPMPKREHQQGCDHVLLCGNSAERKSGQEQVPHFINVHKG